MACLSCLHSLPEHELQEESRDLEEEQKAAGRSELTPFCFHGTRAGFSSELVKCSNILTSNDFFFDHIVVDLNPDLDCILFRADCLYDVTVESLVSFVGQWIRKKL